MRSIHRDSLFRVLIAVVITVLLSSCGQKGELYRPGDQQATLSRSTIDT